MKHELKTNIEYFEASLQGRKPFEIRYNDRGFVVGDTVVLREFNDEDETYTGRRIEGKIGFITRFSQLPGWVVFSLQ